jgi:hypothetical protein
MRYFVGQKCGHSSKDEHLVANEKDRFRLPMAAPIRLERLHPQVAGESAQTRVVAELGGGSR